MINPKKGHLTPDREHSMPDKGNTPPQPEKRWKPIEGMRPGMTWLLTTKKRASVSGTSPLGSKLVGLHRKSRHSGSLNQRAKRQTSCVEC